MTRGAFPSRSGKVSLPRSGRLWVRSRGTGIPRISPREITGITWPTIPSLGWCWGSAWEASDRQLRSHLEVKE